MIHTPTFRLPIKVAIGVILALVIPCVQMPLLLQPRTAHAQDALPDYVQYAVLPQDDNTTAIDIGDMNGDGALDLVIGNWGINVVHFNDGSGQFPTSQPFGDALSTTDIALADIDNDNDLDVLTLNVSGNIDGNELNVIYFNDGGGRLREERHFVPTLTSLIVGDVDGDGNYDLVGDGAVYVNDGMGNFPREILIPDLDKAGQLLDLDGDGDLDLSGYHDLSENPWLPDFNFHFYRNNGTGHFARARLIMDLPEAVADDHTVGDIDGDGDQDVVMTQQDPMRPGIYRGENLRLLLNQDDSTFTVQTLSDRHGAARILLEDFDLDGDLDILVDPLSTNHRDVDNSQIFLYVNHGRANAEEIQFTAVRLGPQHNQEFINTLAIADLNGDGFPEVVVGQDGFNAIYTNQAPRHYGHCTIEWPGAVDEHLIDLAGDGDLDLLYHVEDTELLAAFNDGTGEFTAGTPTGVRLPLYDTRYTSADLDGNGLVDLIALSSTQPAQIFHQVDNDTLFAAPIALDEASTSASSIATGDLDDDGDLDLLLSTSTINEWDEGEVRVYVNNGAGVFEFAARFGKSGALALGDLDNDGDLDVGVGSNIHWNDGAGKLDDSTPLSAPAEAIHAIGDMNSDGFLDILTNGGGRDHLYINDGNRHFRGQILSTAGTMATAPFLLDVDGDRDLDILAESMSAFINDGAGNFAVRQIFPQNKDSDLLAISPKAIGDLNGDGLVDVVGTNIYGFSTQPNPCLALHRKPATRFPAPLPQLTLQQPGRTVRHGPYASPQRFDKPTIALRYQLADPRSTAVDIRATYSPDGGGTWLPAVPMTGTLTTNLSVPSAVRDSTPKSLNDQGVTTSTSTTTTTLNNGEQWHLGLTISHTQNSQLAASLQSPWPPPNGTSIALFDGIGGTRDGFEHLILADGAANRVTEIPATRRLLFR